MSTAPSTIEQVGLENTLSEVWHRNLRVRWKLLEGLSEETLQLYDQALTHWVRLTPNAGIGKIDQTYTGNFALSLGTLKIAPRTKQKHADSINRILEFLGPPTRKRAQALGLVAMPPFVPKLKIEKYASGDAYYVPDEVAKMLAAVDDVPVWLRFQGLKPGTFGRRFVNLAYFLGERRESLLALKPEHLQGDYVLIPPHSKTKKGDVKPMHPSLQQFLAGETWEHEYLCPWKDFHSLDQALRHESRADFSKRFIPKLAQLAGVRDLGCNGFRKAAENAINDAQGEEAARCWANHSSVEITRDHYLSGSRATARRLQELRPIVSAIPEIQQLPTRADQNDADRPLLRLLSAG